MIFWVQFLDDIYEVKRTYSGFPTGTISITQFGEQCNGKLLGYFTQEFKQAWMNIAQAISSSVTLYFINEEGYLFYIELISKYTISQTNKTLLYIFPLPIVHILSSFSLNIDISMGCYRKDNKWLNNLRQSIVNIDVSDIVHLQCGGILSIKKYKVAVNEKQIQWEIITITDKYWLYVILKI